jgi:Pectate lyase superfamily protein
MTRFLTALLLCLHSSVCWAQTSIQNLPPAQALSGNDLFIVDQQIAPSIRRTGSVSLGTLGGAIFGGVTLSGIPSIGYAPIATGPTTAQWQQVGPAVNPVWWGADPTGVADSTAAFNSALAASNHVVFPPGTYLLSSAISYSVPGGPGKSVLIEGSGADLTVLNWTSATDGLDITLATQYSSFHIRNLTLETSAAVGTAGSAISVVLTTGSALPAVSAQSDISFVTIRGFGEDSSRYWTTGIADVGASNVSVVTTSIFGCNTVGGCGTGVSITGLVSATQYAAAWSFTQLYTQQVNVGLELNSYVQGISVTQSQFIGEQFGILAPGSQTGILDGLLVQSSSFNIQGNGSACTTGNGCHGVDLLSPWWDVQVANNVFELNTAYGNAVQFAAANLRCSIFGNDILGGFTTGQTAVAVIGTTTSCNIIGNNFTYGSMAVGIAVGSGTSAIIIADNDLTGVSTAISNNSTATNNKFSDNVGYNPVGSTAATNVGTSPATITAGPSRETHYVNQSATNTATITKNSQQIATLVGASTYYVVELGPNESYVVTWSTTQPTYTKDVH